MHSGNLSQIASPNMRLLVQILLIIWFSLIDKNKFVADNFLETLQFFFYCWKTQQLFEYYWKTQYQIWSTLLLNNFFF